MYIKDEIVSKFREEYAKARPIIEEYNRVKNMSYKALKKHIGESSSSSEKRITEGNELLSMTREDIANNVLYDYTGLADKCSESIDILTNEELDDENYPLSKLQLMARMKVYTQNKKNYRTECIYAPKLYNYLIQCINSKEPFINPVTKAKYTQENIEELMKVMRIIDPKIEVPVFIKHRNDTKLKINYVTHEVNLRDIGADASFGSVSVLRFNKIGFTTKYYGKEGGLGQFEERLKPMKEACQKLENKYSEYGHIKVRGNGMTEFVLKKINTNKTNKLKINNKQKNKTIKNKTIKNKTIKNDTK
jgi:hypothetical protein